MPHDECCGFPRGVLSREVSSEAAYQIFTCLLAVWTIITFGLRFGALLAPDATN